MTARIEMSQNRAKLLAAGGTDLSLKKLVSWRAQTRGWRLVSDAKDTPLKLVSVLECECRLPGCDPVVFVVDVESAATNLEEELREAILPAVANALKMIPVHQAVARKAWLATHAGLDADVKGKTPALPRRLRAATAGKEKINV